MRDNIRTVERVIDDMNSLTLPGRRFQLQRRAYVENARACLESARVVALTLEDGDLAAAETLTSPLVSCFVRMAERAQDIGYR